MTGFVCEGESTGESGSDSAATPQIRIVLNWFEELQEQVPAPWGINLSRYRVFQPHHRLSRLVPKKASNSIN